LGDLLQIGAQSAPDDEGGRRDEASRLVDRPLGVGRAFGSIAFCTKIASLR
jgi:hypothetical protein